MCSLTLHYTIPYTVLYHRVRQRQTRPKSVRQSVSRCVSAGQCTQISLYAYKAKETCLCIHGKRDPFMYTRQKRPVYVYAAKETCLCICGKRDLCLYMRQKRPMDMKSVQHSISKSRARALLHARCLSQTVAPVSLICPNVCIMCPLLPLM